jgi:predicted O-methyltransferase YrrM
MKADWFIQQRLPSFDRVLAPIVSLSARLLKRIRRAGIQNFPRCRQALVEVGLFPIRNHYYEPQFDLRSLRRPLSEPRPLPGIDWNESGQLALLGELVFADELRDIPRARPADAPEHSLHIDNTWFEAGDAELWYQLIRARKPSRIFEVGSGFSTLVAIRALERNRAEGHACRHVCIEPYERPWLEQAGVELLRERVERMDAGFFAALEAGDFLFIDSSHMIRPDGDVLFEYLELRPTLRPGVIVHVHDIFSPRNYPSEWLVDEVLFWNEQYLLEAFLTHNEHWQVLAAANWLKHEHPQRLGAVAPFLTAASEPGSFYLQRRA